MPEFKMILKNNPTVLEIVERLLTDKSLPKRELLRLVLEGKDLHDPKEVLEHFLGHKELVEVE